MKCPNCTDGKSRGFACPGFRLVEIPCDICKGTTVLPASLTFDKDRGNMLKDDRRSRGKTMREEAARLKMPISSYSLQERGYFHR